MRPVFPVLLAGAALVLVGLVACGKPEPAPSPWTTAPLGEKAPAAQSPAVPLPELVALSPASFQKDLDGSFVPLMTLLGITGVETHRFTDGILYTFSDLSGPVCTWYTAYQGPVIPGQPQSPFAVIDLAKKGPDWSYGIQTLRAYPESALRPVFGELLSHVEDSCLAARIKSGHAPDMGGYVTARYGHRLAGHVDLVVPGAAQSGGTVYQAYNGTTPVGNPVMLSSPATYGAPNTTTATWTMAAHGNVWTVRSAFASDPLPAPVWFHMVDDLLGQLVPSPSSD
jgi:hypothetical protein